MQSGRKTLGPIDEQSQKRGFEKEAEHAFHGERLADDSAGGLREGSPIGAELKFHGNTGDHSHGKIDSEDANPEACRTLIIAVAAAPRDGLQHQNQKRQAHGELRKNVMERNGKGELQPMEDQRRVHVLEGRPDAHLPFQKTPFSTRAQVLHRDAPIPAETATVLK